MAKVYKATVYITDMNDDLSNDEVKEALRNLGYELGSDVHIAKVKVSDDFEWEDELKINSTEVTNKDYEEYFQNK